MTIVRPTFFNCRLLFPTINFVFGMNNVVAEYQLSSSVRFDKRGKVSSRFIGPFEILERVGTIAYRLALPPNMSGVRGISRLHAPEVYSRSSSCGGLGID